MLLTLVRSVTCAAVLGGAVYAWHAYPTLPATIGTHFRGGGLADGFSSREASASSADARAAAATRPRRSR